VIWRIGIFPIGALTIIFSLMAWTRLDGKTSPFVYVFENIGIPAAAGGHQLRRPHRGSLLL
jgi:AAT family amino acid transporter